MHQNTYSENHGTMLFNMIMCHSRRSESVVLCGDDSSRNVILAKVAHVLEERLYDISCDEEIPVVKEMLICDGLDDYNDSIRPAVRYKCVVVGCSDERLGLDFVAEMTGKPFDSTFVYNIKP